MAKIDELYQGQPVIYWADGEPNHAVIARICHEDTDDNNRPRVNLAVLLGRLVKWTSRHSVRHIDDRAEPETEKDGYWEEISND